MNDIVRKSVADLLGPREASPGILHRHGRVLMSGWDTVRAGKYYFMGLNPGGEEVVPPPAEETIGASIGQHLSEWNYFSSEARDAHSGVVLPLFEALGAEPLATLTTNAIFLRSATDDTIPEDSDTAWRRHCAPVHNLLLKSVQPRVVVCFGLRTWEYLTGRPPSVAWGFHPQVTLPLSGDEHRGTVLLLPHFSPRGGAARAWKEHASSIDASIIAARRHAHDDC